MPRNGLPRGSKTPLEYFAAATSALEEAEAELTIAMKHMDREQRPAVMLQLAQVQALLGILACTLSTSATPAAYDLT